MFQVFTQLHSARQVQTTELDGNGTPQMDMYFASPIAVGSPEALPVNLRQIMSPLIRLLQFFDGIRFMHCCN